MSAATALHQAQAAGSYADALTLVTQAVQERFAFTLKSLKIRQADKVAQAVAELKLDTLLVESYAQGKLTRAAVDQQLGRLRSYIKDRDSAERAKQAILAFDTVAQALALNSGQSFQYSLKTHARDSLISFARALHR